MSYWPFSHDSQAEQTQSNLQDPPSQHNTRSSGQPLLQPLGLGRASNGPRSPASLASAPGHREFFPPELTVEPPSPSHFEDASQQSGDNMAETEVERLTRVAEAAIAAATAATNALTAAQTRAKKPELPPFDKKNVEIWIQRVEAAYTRAGVVTAKDKFAYLEPKFPVDFNVTINSYLFGNATEARWIEFIAFLKEEFGKNTRQQTATLLSSHPRAGLRPTQFLINLKDKTKKVTLDDIHKEILIKSLPPDVQHSLVDRFEDMTAEETAKAADKFFDNEGKPLSTTSSTVNSVQPQQQHPQQHEEAAYTTPFEEEETDVNFVSKRQFNRNHKFGGNNNNNNFRPKTRPFFSSASSASSNSTRSNTSSTSRSNTNIKPSGLCWAHEKYKQDAQTCFEGCSKFSQHQGKKIYPGNAGPGRRT